MEIHKPSFAPVVDLILVSNLGSHMIMAAIRVPSRAGAPNAIEKVGMRTNIIILDIMHLDDSL